MFRINMRFVLAIMLAAMLCLAGAAVAEESGYTFTYDVLEDGTASITGAEEEVEGKLVIPETIDGYTVTKIGTYAFSDNYDITEAVISDTVREIGYGAFEYCEYLKSVDLSANLEKIDGRAFAWTGLTQITLPESLKSLGDSAFAGADFTSVEIPEGIDTLGDSAFMYCYQLKKAKLPKGLTEIPNDLFYECYALVSANIPSSVHTIGNEAFAYTGLKGIVIPEGVETIKAYAFGDTTDMEYAVIPASVTNIGTEGYSAEDIEYVFHDETKLFVCENSAAHAYALKFGNEYVFTDSGKPEIYEVETTGRRYEGVGDSVTWTIRAIGSEELSYYFRLHRDGEVILSRWQDTPELNHTFAEPGHYTLKTAVKTPEGTISEYFWISSFHVIEEMPEIPTIKDFKLDVPQTVTTGTPITWSYNIIGGSGSFVDALEYSYNIRFTSSEDDRDEDEYDYPGYSYWGVDGGLFVRGSYVPREPGVYRISIIPTDDDGLEGEKYTFPKITVKDSTFKLSKVAHNMNYFEDADEYFVRRGDKVTWKLTPKNAKGKVVYTLRIFNLETWPDRVYKQVVSESPEITVDFDFDCAYPAWQVTAYDKGSDSYYSTEPEWFQFFEADQTYVSYYWDVASEAGYELTIGQENTWYPCDPWEDSDFQQRLDNGEFLFRYEFWHEHEKVYETDWSAEVRVTYAFDKAGAGEVRCFLKDKDGYIQERTDWHNVKNPVSGPESEYEVYDLYYYAMPGGISWDGEIWHAAEWCEESDCFHVNMRYTVYKDNEPVHTTEWMADDDYTYPIEDYGTYTAVIEYQDADGNIVGRKRSYPCEVRKPNIQHFGLSGTNEGTAHMGDMLWWYVFADGGIDISKNEIRISLLRNGETITTLDWQKMDIAEDYDFTSEYGTYFCQSFTISQPGTYAIEAQIRDSKGTLSEKVRSGEIYAVAGPKSALKVDALYCDWISLSLTSDESIHWTAVTSGGAGGNEYTFTLMRNGEVYKTFDAQKGDILTWKPDAEGAYTMKVVVRDSKGAEAESVNERACVVLDSEERTITEMDISAKLICPAVGDKFALALAVEPANPTVKALSFVSDNEQVAVVNKKGIIEIVGAGDAVITVKTLDGSDIERRLVIHAGEYTAAVLPAALDSIRAEAFEGSAVKGVDMSNAASVTLEEGAFAGSSVATLRIPDEVTFSGNVFGDNHVVIYCANDAQAALAQAQDIEFVILK